MYEYIEGTLVAVYGDAAVLDVGGIGFRIAISSSSIDPSFSVGKRVRLWVEMIVRDDAHLLYGFFSTQDRELFRLLQHVSGIGPKLAMTILGNVSAAELASVILQKDVKEVSKTPGIGKKMAERIVIELHDRVQELIQRGPLSIPTHLASLQDAVRALETLGFPTHEAKDAVLEAQKKLPASYSVEMLIQQALLIKR